jgi:ABC-type nitrate/sulfonate/bicarbonate transport system substrate-binding protein
LKGKKPAHHLWPTDQVVHASSISTEANKDVAIHFRRARKRSALTNGVVQVAALSYPLNSRRRWACASWSTSDLGVEDINGTVITTRTFLTQQRDTALRFMRAFTRGMQRYRTDKEFSKKVLAKYGKLNDEEILEGTWQDYAPTLQKSPRPSLKAIQFMIENQYAGKKPLPKPEQFVDLSIVDQLEKSGFIDSIAK